jgi:FkbM family methyltransferase
MSYLKNDLYFSGALFRNEIHEEEVIERCLYDIVKESKVIIDIGAHCGSHSIIYSKINSSASIFAFEPQKVMYDILCKNIEDNNIKNIKTFNNALGNKRCKSSMSKYCSHGPNMSIPINHSLPFNLGSLQVGKGGEEIEISRLDDYDFQNVDYVKIDTEGFEPYILDGAIRLIEKYKPVLFLELERVPTTEDMNDSYIPISKSASQILLDLGYVKYPVDNLDNYLCFNKSNPKHFKYIQ